ncbi:MAG: AAA family ATPase [Acidimicrobiales bacterium]
MTTETAGRGRPEVLILAGPNGAGKTTQSRLLIPDGMPFLNADVIAARLHAQGHPERAVPVAASRVVLAEMRASTAAGRSFCVETNLAGRGFIRWVSDWQAAGYTVRLHFTALDSPELAVRRVAARVAAGGHDVAEAVIRRRWRAGLVAFFEVYLPLVDHWVLLDNGDRLVVVAEGGRTGRDVSIRDSRRWRFLRSLAGLS